MYFVNAFLVMCGIACGMPLLFIANRLSRKYLPADRVDLNKRSVELMEDRNTLDERKVYALEALARLAKEHADQ